MTSAHPRRTRLDEALTRARQIARALAALSLDVDALRPDRPDFEAEREAVKTAFNHERDELAALHGVMRRTLLRRYSDYKRVYTPLPGRLDAMAGFKPERVVENYRTVVAAGRESAERMAAALESASGSYERSHVLGRALWRLGWSDGGYALFHHRRQAAVAVLVLAVMAAVATGTVSLLQGGGDVQASAAGAKAGSTMAGADTTTTSSRVAAILDAGAASNDAATVPSTTVAGLGVIATVAAVAPVDIAGHPAEDAIAQVLAAGIIRLAPDDRGEVRFYPDRPVGRGEFLVWLDRVLPIPASDQAVGDDFFGDVDEPLRSKAIDAYHSRVVLEWARDDAPVPFSPDSLLLPRDAVGWCVRAVIRALPAPSLAAALALTEAEAREIRKDISTLSAVQVEDVARALGLQPAGGFASRDSLTRSEGASLLSALQDAAGQYLEQ